MSTLLEKLGSLSAARVAAYSALGIIFIAGLDHLTGWEISFSFFYLLPILFEAWFGHVLLGYLWALAASVVWFHVDAASGHLYSHPYIPLWNAMVRFGFFAVTTSLLAALKRRYQVERQLASTDFLTGAVNSRTFYNLLVGEISRLQRYGRHFTLVFIDADNFKSVNDLHGHPAGDGLLQSVVKTLKASLRKTDTVARMGGDEFALLLPETGFEAARPILNKAREVLLAAVQRQGLPVTFSMGAVACEKPPPVAKEILAFADKLMYEVKLAGKDGVAFERYPPANP